jgi:hypothetical protein
MWRCRNGPLSGAYAVETLGKGARQMSERSVDCEGGKSAAVLYSFMLADSLVSQKGSLGKVSETARTLLSVLNDSFQLYFVFDMDLCVLWDISDVLHYRGSSRTIVTLFTPNDVLFQGLKSELSPTEFALLTHLLQVNVAGNVIEFVNSNFL